MKPIQKVSLIGLGALGCAYLDRIAAHIPEGDIRVIAEGERAVRYREKGVSVNGLRRFYQVCTPEQPVEPADLLIFTVKYGGLAQAIEQVRGHVGPDTVIISLLNGISSEEDIAAAYGWDKVLYALSLGIDATRVGDDTRSSTLGRIVFGAAENTPGAYSEPVQRLEAFFQAVDMPYEIARDMRYSLWNKFMLNVGFNQISAVLRVPYGAFHRVEVLRALTLDAMREVVALSIPEGIRLAADAPEQALAVCDKLSPTGKTSMYQDIEAGRKTELELFGGTVVALGKKHGIPTPINETLVRLIQSAEQFGIL